MVFNILMHNREAILKVAEAAGLTVAQMNLIIEEVVAVATDFYNIATELTDDIPQNELKHFVMFWEYWGIFLKLCFFLLGSVHCMGAGICPRWNLQLF